MLTSERFKELRELRDRVSETELSVTDFAAQETLVDDPRLLVATLNDEERVALAAMDRRPKPLISDHVQGDLGFGFVLEGDLWER